MSRVPAVAAPPAWRPIDTLLALAFGAAALASRAAVRTTAFYSMDAGLLAVAVEHYDFGDYTPHPPYYPVTILLARLVRLVTGDPFAALTWLAILASTATVVGTYTLGRRVQGRATGALAAALVLLSPLALRSGAVPLSYALEGAASVGVAWLALEVHRDPSPRRAALLGIAASLAIGVRPSSAILLAPLALWGTWPRVRDVCAAAAAGAVATAAWLVPAIVAGGGWGIFAYGLRQQSDAFILHEPVWVGGLPVIANHAAWIAYHLRRELAFFVAVAVVAAVTALRLGSTWPRGVLGWFAAWLLPGLAFYLLVYVGFPVYTDGYLMALLPGLCLLAACALHAASDAVRGDAVPKAAKAIGLAVVVTLGALAVAWPLTWDEAMRPARDAESWQASWAGLEAAFPANESAFVSFYEANWLRLAHPEHLLWTIEVGVPDPRGDGLLYTQVSESRGLAIDIGRIEALRDGPASPPHPVPPWVKRIVLVDGHPDEWTDAKFVQGVVIQYTTLPSGRMVPWIDAAGVADIEDVLAYVQNGPIPVPAEPMPPG